MPRLPEAGPGAVPGLRLPEAGPGAVPGLRLPALGPGLRPEFGPALGLGYWSPPSGLAGQSAQAEKALTEGPAAAQTQLAGGLAESVQLGGGPAAELAEA